LALRQVGVAPLARRDTWRFGQETPDLVGCVLLLVVHIWPKELENGEQVGRISARKATAHER